MKASELRIGNYLKNKDEICVVSTINCDDTIRIFNDDKTQTFGCFALRIFEPIAITEDWLLKAGFVAKSKKWPDGSITDNAYFKKNYMITYDCHGKYFIVSSVICGNMHFICTVEYVHQLQNIYFALTGE